MVTVERVEGFDLVTSCTSFHSWWETFGSGSLFGDLTLLGFAYRGEHPVERLDDS
jgi:hypothetical protein